MWAFFELNLSFYLLSDFGLNVYFFLVNGYIKGKKIVFLNIVVLTHSSLEKDKIV